MEIIDFLSKYNSFALFCHENPDADAVGSICSLKEALLQMGKTCYVFADGELAQKLNFLNVKLDFNENLIQKAEAFILVDCNSPQRTGKYAKYFETEKPIAIIDHHQKGEYKSSCDHIFSNSSSTCDILCEIFDKMKIKISPYMATLLYAGLSSDTGCFVHPTTTAECHTHASSLMQKGIDTEKINYNLFKSKQKNYLEFLKSYIKCTKSYFDGKLLISVVKEPLYIKFKENIEGCGFEFMQGIDKNELAIRITEKRKGEYSISFRSNKCVDVNLLAKLFGGGGHKRASGATSTEKLGKLIKELLIASKRELDKCKV